MKINRTKNATRNIIWGFVEKIIAVLLPFICRTVMIRVMGAEYIGLNSLFTSILSVLSITELGIGAAIIFSMYKPIAEDDKETLCALFNLYKKIYHIIGTIIFVCGLAVLPFLKHFINGNVPHNLNIYILYSIYLFDTVISYFLFAYKAALFSAYQRNDIISKRKTIINFLSNIIQIVLLLLFKNYYIYVIVVPIATMGTNILNGILAQKMYPDIVCKGTISKEMKKDIKKRVAGLIAYKIYNVIFTTVDTIVISSFLGLTQLAIYNNYYYIQNSIVGFMVIFTSAITAGVGNKLVTNSKEDNYEDFKTFSFAKGWICSWAAICLLCLYQHFVRWWAGEELLFPFRTMTLMVLYFLIPRITSMTYVYREAAGLWWEDKFRPLVATILNLGINLYLVRIIGMDGVILSTLICSLFLNFPWGTYILFKHCFKKSPQKYYLQMSYYLIVTAIAGVITLKVCELLPCTGILMMFAKLIICMIIPNILLFIAYFWMSEFKNSKKLVHRIVGTKFKKIGVK